MSEKQAAVEVKQEGEFNLKGKSKPRKPKQLGNTEQEIQKVNIKEPLVEVEPDVKKVEINPFGTSFKPISIPDSGDEEIEYDLIIFSLLIFCSIVIY